MFVLCCAVWRYFDILLHDFDVHVLLTGALRNLLVWIFEAGIQGKFVIDHRIVVGGREYGPVGNRGWLHPLLTDLEARNVGAGARSNRPLGKLGCI